MAKSNGYIKLWRKVRDWSYSGNCKAIALWVVLLTEATHKERIKVFKGKPLTLKPGQFITGRKYLSALSGVNRSSVERYLEMFEKLGQIEQQKSNKNRLITILNWVKYQKDEQQTSNKRATNEQQTSTYKNDKNVNNDKNGDTTSFWNHFLLKTRKKFILTDDKKKLITQRLKDYPLEELKRAVDNFVADKWEGRKDNLDLIYCIGKQKGKRDNLENWINKEKPEWQTSV